MVLVREASTLFSYQILPYFPALLHAFSFLVFRSESGFDILGWTGIRYYYGTAQVVSYAMKMQAVLLCFVASNS